MPSDFLLKAMNLTHRIIRKVSGERVGWTALRMPVVELTTVGRKSGRRHTVMLTSPMKSGDALVLVASRGGDDHHPAWFLNLVADPEVEIRLGGGEPRRTRAQVATPAQRSTLWPQIAAEHRNYASYQAKTDREIPLVLLSLNDN